MILLGYVAFQYLIFCGRVNMFFIGVVPFGITTNFSNFWVPIFLHLLVLIFYYKGFIFFCLCDVCLQVWVPVEVRKEDWWISATRVGVENKTSLLQQQQTLHCWAVSPALSSLLFDCGCLFCMKRQNTSIPLFLAVAFLLWRSVYENLLPLKVYCLNLLLNYIGTLE